MAELNTMDNLIERVRMQITQAQLTLEEAGTPDGNYDEKSDRVIAKLSNVEIASIPLHEVSLMTDAQLKERLMEGITRVFGDRRRRPFREPEM